MKSLIRGLRNFKLRLFLMLFLIFMTAMMSVTLREFSSNAEDLYVNIYDETNLADIIVETDTWMYPENAFLEACSGADSDSKSLKVNKCETRISVDGRFKRSDGVWIPALVYGHVPDSQVTQLFPNKKFPIGSDNDGIINVIVDTHAVEQLAIEDGDLFLLNINNEVNEVRVKSSGSSPLHLWFAPTESIIPPEDGEFAVIYMDVSLLAEIIDVESNMRNMMLIDLDGTPQYDLQNTREDEGEELKVMKDTLSEHLKSGNIEIFQVLDRGNIFSVELLRQDLGGAKVMAPAMTVMLTLVSGFVLAISIDRMIMSHRKEIGTLRSLGVSGGELTGSYVILSLVIGIIASSPGLVAGYFLSESFIDFYFSFWGISTELLAKQHDVVSIAGVGAFIVTVVTVSSFIAMMRMNRISPLELLRPEASSSSSKMLGSYVSLFPNSIRIGLRSTLRKPKRLLLTVVALGLAMLMLGGMLMTMASMFDYYGNNIEKTEKWDARLYFAPNAYQQLHDEISSNNLKYEFASVLDGRAKDGDDIFSVWGISDSLDTENKNKMHQFILSSGEYPLQNQDVVNVIIDGGTALFLEWDVGDVVDIEILGKETKVKITGLADELERTMWMYDSDLADIIGIEMYNVVMVTGADEGIENLISYSHIIYFDDYVNAFNEGMENFGSIFVVFILIGASIAIAVLLNTLIINVTEKDQELATMSILGFDRLFLTKILVVENVIIGVVGGIIGVIASILTTRILMSEFVSWEFYWELSARTDISIVIFLFILLTSILSSGYGYWRIKKISLVEKSRFE